MPKSPNRDTETPFVKWLIRRREAEDELVELKRQANDIKLETEKTIMELNDELYQMILIMRYIEWMTWQDISSKLYFSVPTIKRKHEKAILILKF